MKSEVKDRNLGMQVNVGKCKGNFGNVVEGLKMYGNFLYNMRPRVKYRKVGM